MRRAKFVFIVLAVMGAGFFSGINYEREVAEPLVQTVVKEIPVEVPVVVEVEKVVVTEVPLELREFCCEWELKKWISNRVERRVIFLTSNEYDCYDAAEDMVEDAMEDGLDMRIQIIDGDFSSPVSGTVINEEGGAHALVSTTIGNDIYCVEPALNEYWRAWTVD